MALLPLLTAPATQHPSTSQRIAEYWTARERGAVRTTCRAMATAVHPHLFTTTPGCTFYGSLTDQLCSHSFVPLTASQGWIMAVYTLLDRPLRSHRHLEQAQLLSVLQGKLLAQVDTTEVELGPGQWFMVPMGATHSARSLTAECIFLSCNMPGFPYPKDVHTDRALPTEGLTRLALPATRLDLFDGLSTATKATLMGPKPVLDPKFYTAVESSPTSTTYRLTTTHPTATHKFQIDIVDFRESSSTSSAPSSSSSSSTTLVRPTPVQEVLHVVQGELAVTTGATTHRLIPGQSVSLPVGALAAGSAGARALRVSFWN